MQLNREISDDLFVNNICIEKAYLYVDDSILQYDFSQFNKLYFLQNISSDLFHLLALLIFKSYVTLSGQKLHITVYF